MELDELAMCRRLAVVPRWAIVPTIRHQSVAEHSFHVACIASRLWDLLSHRSQQETYKGAVLEAALRHDMTEAITGDTPGPTKDKKDAPIRVIDIVVKLADYLEALSFIDEECQHGNKQLRPIADSMVKKIKELKGLLIWRDGVDIDEEFNKIATVGDWRKWGLRDED